MKNTLRLAAMVVMAVASFTFTGCGDSRDKYDQTLIDEYERRIKELEDQLVMKNEGITKQVLHDAPAGTNPVPEAVGSGVGTSSDHLITVFTIENSILFRPGSADLSAAAKAALTRVATVIKEKYPNHYIRVDGHTDNQVITRSKDKWDDNWDLAGGRAQKVLHYLLERGVAADNLGFAGFADHRPLAPNTSDANKQKNRRVEIRVIPKEDGKDSK